MKIYVAGNYSEDKLRCRSLMAELKNAGHEITEDWTDPKYNNAPHVLCCQVDVEGIRNADCIVFCAIFDRKYRGAFVEMGMALALGKPVYVLGNAIDTCVFTAHPLVRKFQSFYELIEVVEKGNDRDEKL